MPRARPGRVLLLSCMDARVPIKADILYTLLAMYGAQKISVFQKGSFPEAYLSSPR